MYGKFVSIDTKDGRSFDGVHVEGWQSYQEALNDELLARGAKRGQVDKVWSNGKVVYDSKKVKPFFSK